MIDEELLESMTNLAIQSEIELESKPTEVELTLMVLKLTAKIKEVVKNRNYNLWVAEQESRGF